MASHQAISLAALSDDGPVIVVHVIRYRDGGRDSMVGYQDHASVVAGRHGGQVAGWFDVEGTIVGDGRQWDQVRFNRFPSKAAFLAVVADPDLRARLGRGARERSADYDREATGARYQQLAASLLAA